MSDLISLVLGIPSIVEGFVNTCRAIEAYGAVESKHLQIIADAVHYSKKLNYYARFVDQSTLKEKRWPGNDGSSTIDGLQKADIERVEVGDEAVILRDSQTLLAELFRNSLLALSSARKIVDEWTIRLKIGTHDRRRDELFIAKLALTISDRLSRKSRSSGRRQENSIVANFYGKTAFLVIGSQQIEDAMGRLKHWLSELHDILMVSPVLRNRLADLRQDILKLGKDLHEDVLFVAMARARESKASTMETVKPEFISSLQPLDNRKSYNIMLVESKESPYYGCLVDRRNVLHLVNKGKEEQALRDTELIARLFAEEHDELGHDVSASVGILPCCGFSRPSIHYHDLIFRLPDSTRRPRALRSLLLQGNPRHALNDRLNFSIKLATALLIVHSLRLVHKDIRPDSIIVLDRATTIDKTDESLQALGEPYLVAFNESRSVDSATVPKHEVRSAESRWDSLYTHPRHLLAGPHRPFEMRDDIYSLGICLLEIAIWRSLFVWDETQKTYVNDTNLCDLSDGRYDKLLEELGEDVNRTRAWLRQRDLVVFTEQNVPVAMGSAFKEVIVECLTFGTGKKTLAEVVEERDLGRTHMQDQSVAFIRNILSKLRGLKLS